MKGLYSVSNLKVGRISLLEEFVAFRDSTDKLKVLKLRRKIQKFLKTSETGNTQLLDVLRVLDLWVEEIDYNDFSHSFRIALPVVERLSRLGELDFYDIVIAAHVCGYGRDYIASYEFAKKIFEDVEKHKSHKRYLDVKLATGMNATLRLLRARYFELDHTESVDDLGELTIMFMEYVGKIMTLCKDHKELWEYKTVAQIRKALFERNYSEVDMGLALISEKGSYIVYKVLAEEINGFSAFAGVGKTKMLLNLQIGKNIRKIRKSAYLRIEDFASMLNIAPSALQSIEQGKRSTHIHNLYKLSETLDFSLDEIVKGKIVPVDKNKDYGLSEEMQALVNVCKSLKKSDIVTLNALAKQLSAKN